MMIDIFTKILALAFITKRNITDGLNLYINGLPGIYTRLWPPPVPELILSQSFHEQWHCNILKFGVRLEALF